MYVPDLCMISAASAALEGWSENIEPMCHHTFRGFVKFDKRHNGQQPVRLELQ